jgi:NADH-quinone oxidoreductase subunit D
VPAAPALSRREGDAMLDTRELEINMGPQHPSTHGVLRVVLRLDGETVVGADCDIGYLHRGVEKLAERREYFQALTLTDRTDYVAAIYNNLGYVETVEKLLGIEAPPRARWVRTLLGELSRISSHLLWLATHGHDIGAMTVFLYCFREREKILDLFEEYCGARLTTTTFRIGGLRDDLPAGFLDRTARFIDDFPAKVAEYEQLLTENRIWIERTRNVGVIAAADAISWGLCGPILRGSGVRWDLRKDLPYAAYDEVDFDVPIGERGDTYDRYLVRMEEMRQSARIVRQCIERMPAGDIKVKVPKVRPAKGMVYHAVEGPKGELGYLLVSDGSPHVYRLHIRPPSLINLQALPDMVRGQLVADVIAVIGSIDIVLGEVDR